MIFLDTSFIISFYNEEDDNHKKAWKIMEDLIKDKYGDVVISDYIFNECATVLYLKLKDLKKTTLICETIKQIEIFRVSKGLFEETWKVFKNQKNTKLSFTDCSILALMREKRIKHLATFDKEFSKINDINIVG